MSVYPDGVYRARILDYGIQATAKGDPKVFVEFQIKDTEGNVGRITWSSGFYSETGTEITIANLITMGLESAERINDMAEGVSSRTLNTTQIYDVTVQNKPHWKDSSRMVPEVRFINKEGEGRRDNERMDKRTAQSKLSSLSLGAAFHNAKAKTLGGVEPGSAIHQDLSKIPF